MEEIDMDLLGAYDDEDDDDEMGLRLFRPRKLRRVRSRARRQVARAINPPTPGVNRAAPRKYVMGIGTASFVLAGATTINLTASPQKPFKGSRLVISTARTGATATGLVTMTNFNIGQNSQLVNGVAIPTEAFAPNSFDTMLALDAVVPGISVSLDLTINVLPTVAGESVAVAVAIIGLTLG